MGLPPGGSTRAPLVVQVAPDFSRRLSDATLVEASVSARLLGMRLLTLDATVVLVPAEESAATPDASAQDARPAAGSAQDARPAAGRGRHGLADAVRNLEQGAKLLAEARCDGS